MNERDRAIIAAHEVGHAICGKVHGDKREVEEISLFAHGEALGVTVSSQEDNDLPSESDLRARLVALMGGRAAEELLFHEVTAGAANDFEKATQIATTMVTLGHGPRPRGHRSTAARPRHRCRSSFRCRAADRLPTELQAAATRAIAAILDEAYAEACQTLDRAHRHAAPDRRLPRRARAHRRRHLRRALRRPARRPERRGEWRAGRPGRGPGATSWISLPIGPVPPR